MWNSVEVFLWKWDFLCLLFSFCLNHRFTCRQKWRRHGQPTPVLLPGKSHGRRSLVGCSPWGREELDMTEWLHFHFSLSCIREGNGNPLQCSCLENPRDGGAWWAAVYGVAQSRTQLKQLSISQQKHGMTKQKQMFFWNSCFFNDPEDVDNLISGSSAFSKSSLNTWKFMVHILLKLAWRILSITLLACEMNAVVW